MLEDRHRELAALRRSLDDLNDLYHRRKHSNDVLECNITHLNRHVDVMKYHNREIGHDLHHAADREAYLYGTYGKAAYLHHKQRDYNDDLRHSEYHVDYVRAHSPARSPRRY